MSSTVPIRGIDVDTRWLISNAAWIAATLAVWPFIFVSLRRLRKQDRRKESVRSMRIRWAHVVAIMVCLTLAGIDQNNVIFDWFRPFNLFIFAQYTIILVNLFIYYFSSHVKAFFVATGLNNLSTSSDSLARTRRYFMFFNLIVGEIIVVATFIIQRLFLISLVYVFIGVQILFMGPTLLFMVYSITKSVNALQHKARSGRDPEAGAAEASPRAPSSSAVYLRRFQRWGIGTASIAIFFGIALNVLFAPLLGDDPSVRYSTINGWGNRNHAGVFKPSSVYFLNWCCLATEVFVVWLHFMPDRSVGSKTAAGAAGSSNGGKRFSFWSRTTASAASSKTTTPPTTLPRMSSSAAVSDFETMSRSIPQRDRQSTFDAVIEISPLEAQPKSGSWKPRIGILS